MITGISIGDPRFKGGEIVIQVAGTIDMDTVDELSARLKPHLRPPGITLDCSEAVIRGHGANRLLVLQQDNPTCRIKLINVSPRYRSAFESRRMHEMGFDIQYQPEVA